MTIRRMACFYEQMTRAEFIEKLNSYRKSATMKKLLSYGFFVIISAIFWVFNNANKSQIQDVELPFEIVSVPDSVMFLSDAPKKINVSIRETALNYFFKKKSKIEVEFSDYDNGNGVFKINEQQLNALIRDKYSKESTINTILPDSVSLRYVDPRYDSKVVPIVLDFTAKANMQYEIVGKITMSQDSVVVYANREHLNDVDAVYTYHVDEKELTDSLIRKVSISPIQNVRIEPREVNVMVPVEKLIKRVRVIPVVVRNKPENINVITFPSEVKVSYLVPKSQYNNSDKRVVATVDYNDILDSPIINKVEVRIGEVPMAYKNVSIDADSVEYIIEKLEK